jgi:hypothetical protein
LNKKAGIVEWKERTLRTVNDGNIDITGDTAAMTTGDIGTAIADQRRNLDGDRVALIRDGSEIRTETDTEAVGETQTVILDRTEKDGMIDGGHSALTRDGIEIRTETDSETVNEIQHDLIGRIENDRVTDGWQTVHDEGTRMCERGTRVSRTTLAATDIIADRKGARREH